MKFCLSEKYDGPIAFKIGVGELTISIAGDGGESHYGIRHVERCDLKIYRGDTDVTHMLLGRDQMDGITDGDMYEMVERLSSRTESRLWMRGTTCIGTLETLPILWSHLKKGDEIYLRGNHRIENGNSSYLRPCVYGPHTVHDPEKRELINSKGQTFLEYPDELCIRVNKGTSKGTEMKEAKEASGRWK